MCIREYVGIAEKETVELDSRRNFVAKNTKQNKANAFAVHWHVLALLIAPIGRNENSSIDFSKDPGSETRRSITYKMMNCGHMYSICRKHSPEQQTAIDSESLTHQPTTKTVSYG